MKPLHNIVFFHLSVQQKRYHTNGFIYKYYNCDKKRLYKHTYTHAYIQNIKTSARLQFYIKKYNGINLGLPALQHLWVQEPCGSCTPHSSSCSSPLPLLSPLPQNWEFMPTSWEMLWFCLHPSPRRKPVIHRLLIRGVVGCVPSFDTVIHIFCWLHDLGRKVHPHTPRQAEVSVQLLSFF